MTYRSRHLTRAVRVRERGAVHFVLVSATQRTLCGQRARPGGFIDVYKPDAFGDTKADCATCKKIWIEILPRMEKGA